MFDSEACTDRLQPYHSVVQNKLPNQRWKICQPSPELAQQLAEATGLEPLLVQVLINRGITTPAEAQAYLNPESVSLPSPIEEFPDLAKSLDLLQQAILNQQKIAICGDYDADGMTSTALLIRALRWLGGLVDYAIPSRMSEGYGINRRIVEEFHEEGIALVLTVDNGISAYDPIERATQLGLKVIITDHHDIPEKLPPADAILNPKLIRETSPYRGVAGVGVAYILAISLAQKLDKLAGLIHPLQDLLTLGTIADLAPLTGVNRRWLKRGLRQLPHSTIPGIQALMQVGGVNAKDIAPTLQTTIPQNPKSKTLKPEDIGFRLGPRINAVGRIGNPQIIIELLTTDDPGIALERAMQCEQINQSRQQLCEQIEQEAIAWIETQNIDIQQERVLVVVQPDWHHGVIGIVASRLVERYGVPVFIGTYEDAHHIRGSARSIPEFHIFEALQSCDDLLMKYGGHRAAGGFSMPVENLPAFQERLHQFACQCLELAHLKPLVQIDTQANFAQITAELYQQIDALQPCGIENNDPIFWTANVRVLDQRIVGKGHLKFTFLQESNANMPAATLKGMAWRWGDYFPIPPRVDVAYKLKENHWNGQTSVELEIVGMQLANSQNVQEAQVAKNTENSPILNSEKPLLIHSKSITLLCPKAPKISALFQWKTGENFYGLLSKLTGRVFLYGANLPAMPAEINCDIELERPRQVCETFVLWTLPPSKTHLQWLLAAGKPEIIYIYNQQPPLPFANSLREQLQLYLQQYPDQPLNLLQLGQHWWIAPCTIVAALRELGYSCPEFPETSSLYLELEKMRRWYEYPAHQLSQLKWD